MSEQDLPEIPSWLHRQLDHAVDIERGEANARRGIVLGNGYFSLTPMNEQTDRRWSATNSYASWSIRAGEVYSKRHGWIEAPLPTGKPALLIGAAISTKIRSIAKAGGNPLDGVPLEDTQRAIAKDLGYASSGGRQHKELTRQLNAFAVATFQIAEWGPDDTAGGYTLHQHNTVLASDVSLYVPGWGDPLDGLDSRIVPSQLLVDLALDPKTPPVRLDALARMSGPFPMQVAVWLEKVLFSIRNGPRKERVFQWSDLFDELTHGYKQLNNFRTKLLQALDEVAATRRVHGNGIDTNFSVEPAPGKPGRSTVLVIRRSPLLRNPAGEL